MLKINLLPPYINQRSKIRTAWTLMAFVVAAEIVGLTLVQSSQVGQEQQLISDVQGKEQQGLQVDKYTQEAQAERAKIQPIKDKTDFINGLFTFNKARPDLYEHVASYIYREVWVSGMQADENVLTMPASASSISAVGRFLLFMQNNPDFTQVRISSVPGWPPGTAGVEASPLTGNEGAGGGPGGPAGSGGPMMSGGPPGGPAGSGGPPGGPPGGEGGAPPSPGDLGSGGGPPGFGGGGAPPIFGGGAGIGGPGLMNVPSPGGEALTSGGAPIPYPTNVGPVKTLPVYFGFTVTGTLTKPINRPTYQAPGADTSGGNGPGGPMMSGGYGSGAPPYGSGGSGGPMMSGGPPGGPK